jgi:hypothetical protein
VGPEVVLELRHKRLAVLPFHGMMYFGSGRQVGSGGSGREGGGHIGDGRGGSTWVYTQNKHKTPA